MFACYLTALIRKNQLILLDTAWVSSLQQMTDSQPFGVVVAAIVLVRFVLFLFVFLCIQSDDGW